MTPAPQDWLTLESPGLYAAIDPEGAQLSLLRDAAGRDLLWNGDPTVWKGRAPLLFPIVGELADGRYRIGTRSYRLPRHGFARDRRFEATRLGGGAAEFRLAADHSSREVYPFEFALTVRFELADSSLAVSATVRNDGEAPMPASFGFHPAFRWPLPFGRPRAEHGIEFEHDERDPIRRLDAHGLLTALAQATPIHDRRLALADALFEHDALILDRLRSRSVLYGAPGAPRVRVSFPAMPYLGLWTKPGAGFICIEPWHGLADPQDFSGDIGMKPGMFTVMPGGARTLAMAVTLVTEPPAR